MFKIATQAAAQEIAPALPPFVTRVLADGGYAGRLAGWAADKTSISLEIIRRGVPAKSFKVLPRRWLVKRTFA